MTDFGDHDPENLTNKNVVGLNCSLFQPFKMIQNSHRLLERFSNEFSVTRERSEKLSNMQSAKAIEMLMLHGFTEMKVKLVKPLKPKSMTELSKEKTFLLLPRKAYKKFYFQLKLF